METPSTGYIALLLLCWSLQTVAVRDCSGLSPGYYADLSTSCRTYLLCRGKARSRGLHFNCPPGTKFHQATQVCHHESSVKCEEDQEIISIAPDSPRRLSEQPDNSVDATSKLDDSIRFKREKLTEQLHVSNKESEDVRKNKIIKKKKNKNIKNRLRKKKKTLQKQQVLKTSTNNPVKSRVEEVDKTLELDQDDGGVSVHNCRDGKSLCKSFKLRKEEIGENIRLPANKDNKARIDVVVEEDDASLERVENAGTPRPTLLIPSPVNDTSKLSEDPTLQKPIKSDSVGIQNTSQYERPESPPPPVPSKLQPKLKLRTRPLDKIPFSRVVAAQKKINGQFSPYISFPELLTNLTKSQRSVRMIPIAVSSTEADFIRKIIRKNTKSKTKKSDLRRLPRKIPKTVVKDKEKSKKEYQIIYKDVKPQHEPLTTTEHEGEPPGNKTNNKTNWSITVKPRGPPKGFFNREKFKQILTSNLRTDKDLNKDTTAEPSLEFGFSPIKSKERKTKDKRRKAKQDVYFDEFLDTLQAPGNTLSNSPGPAKNSKRSPKHFAHHSQTNSLKKLNLDRKSNLDFLGIFDTRKYFFIPPNRRSDDSEAQSPGILSNIVRFFRQ